MMQQFTRETQRPFCDGISNQAVEEFTAGVARMKLISVPSLPYSRMFVPLALAKLFEQARVVWWAENAEPRQQMLISSLISPIAKTGRVC